MGGDAMGGQPDEPAPLIPKRQPTPEDTCDGLDDDNDDFVDEGSVMCAVDAVASSEWLSFLGD